MSSVTRSVCVMHVITGLNIGGAERMLLQLLTHTRHRSIVVSLTGRGALAEQIESLGIPVHSLGLARNLSALQGLGKLKAIMGQHSPTVVHSWLYAADCLASFAARSLNIPLWWNVRQSETDWVSGQWHIGLNQRINGYLSRRWPDGIVYCAHKAQREHHRIGYQGRTETVIANGVNTQDYFPDTTQRNQLRANWRSNLSAELRLDQESTVVGIVGRYDPLKNHALFLEVVAGLRARLGGERTVIAVMVGRNIEPNNKDLMEKVNALGLQACCQLLGERDDVKDLMNAMDLVLLTSNSEGWPNVLGEAMACGRICVSSDVGDVAAVTGEAGFVVSPVTSEGFIDACEQALALSDEDQQKLRAQARQRIIDHFSLDKAVDCYDALYDRYPDSGSQCVINRREEGA